MRMFLRREHGDFFVRTDIAECKLYSETIHLRFGQRIRAAEFNGVLSGDHKEKLGQGPAFTFDTHLILTHRFEKSRLRARRSAIDLVGEKDAGKDRPLVEMEL